MQKRVALVVAAVVLLAAAAVGIWTLVEPGSYGNRSTGCVHVAIPSSTGGATIDHCGGAARAWCTSEATAEDALADRARMVCREAGLLPARP